MKQWEQEWIRRWRDGGLSEDEFPLDELPKVNENENWEVTRAWRRTACENRPGLRMFYVNVNDVGGKPMPGIKVAFDTEIGDNGVICDRPNIWGLTGGRYGREGYAEWRHPGIVNIYKLYIEGELLIENIRLNLRNEYCRPPGQFFGGWIPVNRRGVFSYDIVVEKK